MQVRLPGQDDWALAQADSVAIRTKSSLGESAVAVLDGSAPFGGSLDPSVVGKIVSYELPGFAPVLADHYCTMTWEATQFLCKNSVTQVTRLLDFGTTFNGGGGDNLGALHHTGRLGSSRLCCGQRHGYLGWSRLGDHIADGSVALEYNWASGVFVGCAPARARVGVRAERTRAGACADCPRPVW